MFRFVRWYHAHWSSLPNTSITMYYLLWIATTFAPTNVTCTSKIIPSNLSPVIFILPSTILFHFKDATELLIFDNSSDLLLWLYCFVNKNIEDVLWTKYFISSNFTMSRWSAFLNNYSTLKGAINLAAFNSWSSVVSWVNSMWRRSRGGFWLKLKGRLVGYRCTGIRVHYNNIFITTFQSIDL